MAVSVSVRRMGDVVMVGRRIRSSSGAHVEGWR